MEIEAKPKLNRSYVHRQIDYVVSAYKIGLDKVEQPEWLEFLKGAERVFLEDAQQIAEIAFNKGREYERRNGAAIAKEQGR